MAFLADGVLHVMVAAGGVPSPLTRPGDEVNGFDWTPDGTRLVYSLTENAVNLWGARFTLTGNDTVPTPR